MLSILDRIDDDSNIVKHREDGVNDVVLGKSLVRGFGAEVLNIRKFWTKESSD